MKLRYIKQNYLDQLKRMNEKAMSKWYAEPTCWLDNLFNHEKWYAQSKIEIAGNIELITEGDPAESDLENSIRIYNVLKDKLTDVQASDPRFWAYLCHETCWDYMKWRWPTAKADIERRYFVHGNNSRALSRNGIARLWWFAHLTYDESRANPYELTKVFLRNQDIQHNLVERNFGRSRVILHTTLNFLKSRPKLAGKADYVKLGKIINKWGGVRLLDCLTREEVMNYLEARF